MRHRIPRIAPQSALTTGAVLLLLLAGCVSQEARVQSVEQMLAAAGFQARPANTPQRQAQLQTLPPHRLMMQQQTAGNGDEVAYVYADPLVCHCLFVGGAENFSRFHQLAFQQRLADQYAATVRMQQQAAFDWSMWGPGFWAPAPVFIPRVHEHDHDHDHDDRQR